jgi:hypothetical protein
VEAVAGVPAAIVPVAAIRMLTRKASLTSKDDASAIPLVIIPE